MATLVQMAGVLVLAAGVPRAFTHRDFAVVVVGYLIMRVALVFQWLRASRHAESAATARRYAVGTAAAVGAGIAVAIDRVGGDHRLSQSGAGLALAVPVVVYLLATWAVHSLQPTPPIKRIAVPVACVAVIAAAFLPETVLLVAPTTGPRPGAVPTHGPAQTTDTWP